MSIEVLTMIFAATLVSAAMGAVAVWRLEKDYINSNGKIFWFFFLFNAAMPFLAVPLSFWMLGFLKKSESKRSLDESYYERLRMDRFIQEFPKTKRLFGEGAMQIILSPASGLKHMKLRALAVLSSQVKREHLSIIKKTLADRDDEVRLYSFSMIDKLEKEINEEIGRYLDIYKKHEEGDERRLNAARALAQLYWDLVYYELADEVIQSFLVDEVRKYLNEYLKRRYEDVEAHVLLGKVFLHEGLYEKAEREFAFALEWDSERYSFVAPYLAQLFFMRRNFVSVKVLLQHREDLNYNQKLHPVVTMWSDNK